MQITQWIMLWILAFLCLFLFFPTIFKNLLKARRKVKNVDSRESFEDFCLLYLRKKKYRHVKQTPRVKDGGADLIAYKYRRFKRVKRVCECKYYPNSKVDVKIIRALYGVAKRRNARAMLLYVGGITKDAKQEANYYDVKLVRFNR